MGSMFDSPGMGGAMPAAPAAGNPGMPGIGGGGGTFTDLLNTLSGGDVTDAIQGLTNGIGSFAKNPQTRAAYIQAAQMHQQHKGASADKDYEALLSLAPEYQKIAQQAQGRPEILQALMPSLQHWVQNVDIAAKRAGKSPVGADILGQIQAAATAPAAPTGPSGAERSIAFSNQVNAGRPGTSQESPAHPTTQKEFDGLMAGAWFVNPADGQVMQKTH